MTPAAAVAEQRRLAQAVECRDRFGEIRSIAGVDVGFEAAGQITRAAIVVLAVPTLERIDAAIARRPTEFPYIPGLLSYRELPAVLDALQSLQRRPDLLLVDGQGVAHPRRCGLASHLGLRVDLPSIGVAKSRLWGSHGPVPPDRGAWTPLRDRDETIGAVLRTRVGVAPLYVSVGHRVSLATAIAWVMAAITRSRLPETTRQAHRLASGPDRPPPPGTPPNL